MFKKMVTKTFVVLALQLRVLYAVDNCISLYFTYKIKRIVTVAGRQVLFLINRFSYYLLILIILQIYYLYA